MKQNKNIPGPKKKEQPVKTSGILSLLFYGCFIFLIGMFFLQLKAPKQKVKGRIRFSYAAFLQGVYQDDVEENLNKKSNLAERFLPLKNEIDYLLFDKINLQETVMGKENYIFSETNIRSYFGEDFIGEDKISTRLKKLKFLQDTLKKKDISLITVYVPGKACFYPEYLPDGCENVEKRKSNYDVYVKFSKAYGINFIDFRKHTLSIKKTSAYPLFSQYGSHWSYYAECKAVDSTIKYLEKVSGKLIPELVPGPFHLLDSPMVRDADIFLKAPLLETPPGKKLAYPSGISYRTAPGAQPMKVLGIGDSYYRCFLYLGAMANAFDNGMFWYYYTKLVPESDSNPEIWELDLKAEIEKHKAIILFYSDGNLPTFGNGFIEDAYDLYHDPKKYYENLPYKRAIQAQKKQIRSDKYVLKKLTKQSLSLGISLDSLISAEAGLKLKHRD